MVLKDAAARGEARARVHRQGAAPQNRQRRPATARRSPRVNPLSPSAQHQNVAALARAPPQDVTRPIVLTMHGAPAHLPAGWSSRRRCRCSLDHLGAVWAHRLGSGGSSSTTWLRTVPKIYTKLGLRAHTAPRPAATHHATDAAASTDCSARSGIVVTPAGVAQLVAHSTCNRAARGSSPLTGSNNTFSKPARQHDRNSSGRHYGCCIHMNSARACGAFRVEVAPNSLLDQKRGDFGGLVSLG